MKLMAYVSTKSYFCIESLNMLYYDCSLLQVYHIFGLKLSI